MKLKTLFSILVLTTTMLFASIQQSRAQAVFAKTASNPTSTITNTGSDTLSYTLPGYFDLVSFQPVITKTSGTVAGSGILYGSVNGSQFHPTGDTITLTNVSKNSAIWIKTQHPYLYYRFIITGSGTMVATAVMNVLARKHT